MASYVGTGALTGVGDDCNTGSALTSGAPYATAVVTLSGTFVATVTWEQTLDGTNWIPSAYAKRTDATSANPATAATATVPGTYEIPLPANAKAIRARCSAYTSGTVNVSANPGALYVPGMPVTATLDDGTVANAVAYTGPVLDVSGWTSIHVAELNSDTGGTNRNFFFSWIDDGGGAPGTINGTLQAVNSGSTFTQSLGSGGGGTTSAPSPALPRRIRPSISAGAGTAGSSRMITYARR